MGWGIFYFSSLFVVVVVILFLAIQKNTDIKKNRANALVINHFILILSIILFAACLILFFPLHSIYLYKKKLLIDECNTLNLNLLFTITYIYTLFLCLDWNKKKKTLVIILYSAIIADAFCPIVCFYSIISFILFKHSFFLY